MNAVISHIENGTNIHLHQNVFIKIFYHYNLKQMKLFRIFFPLCYTVDRFLIKNVELEVIVNV